MTDLSKMLGPLDLKLRNLVARGRVVAANSAGKIQRLQLRLKADVEHFEPFGLTGKPLQGAEHVTLFLDGDRSHGVTIVVSDRRYRLQGLQDGEVALHDAHGNSIHLKADGTILMTAATVQITGDLQVNGTITASEVFGGGKSLKTHTHPSGTPNTGAPNS